MHTRLFINNYADTRLGAAVYHAIRGLGPGETSFDTCGLHVEVGPNGPFVERDEYLHTYPNFADEQSVWEVEISGTMSKLPGRRPMGIFVNGDTRAVLSVEHAPDTGAKYFKLTVTGRKLAEVHELHRLVRAGRAEKFRTETWPE